MAYFIEITCNNLVIISTTLAFRLGWPIYILSEITTWGIARFALNMSVCFVNSNLRHCNTSGVCFLTWMELHNKRPLV